jgi:hypothetical protein
MTPSLIDQIAEALDRYKVRYHWRGSREASIRETGRLSRYAVFRASEALTAPLPHAEALAHQRTLLIADLAALIEGEPK